MEYMTASECANLNCHVMKVEHMQYVREIEQVELNNLHRRHQMHKTYENIGTCQLELPTLVICKICASDLNH